ncbi:MAG TPA: hypothetical protein VGP72_16055 [Planctomycetota bacterium]
MKMFVKAELFESIIAPEAISSIREEVRQQIQRISHSGKLESGWAFADHRCVCFIVNADSPYEVMDLLGNTFVDHFRLETHPIVSLEELGKFFEEHQLVGSEVATADA